MRGDFHSNPVAIRISCRYVNGSVVHYGARALFCGEFSLRILCPQYFEPGITLQVLARFLEGLTTCRVSAIRRSRKQRGNLELDLEFVEEPVPATAEIPEIVPEKARRTVPEELALAAKKLAGQLERDSTKRLSQVLEAFPAASRRPALFAGVAALLLLLGEKDLAYLRHVLAAVRERQTQ